MKTVCRVYDSYAQARAAVDALGLGPAVAPGWLASEDAPRVATILDGYRSIDPALRRDEYRRTGWHTSDASAPPYRPSQTEIDRIRANWPG
jgi:hypothetical protein